MLLPSYVGALWITVLCWTWGDLKSPAHLRAPEMGSIFKVAGPSPPRLTVTPSAQPGGRGDPSLSESRTPQGKW